MTLKKELVTCYRTCLEVDCKSVSMDSAENPMEWEIAQVDGFQENVAAYVLKKLLVAQTLVGVVKMDRLRIWLSNRG